MIREGTIQIPFRYAAGELGSRFLVALRDEGRILGAPCPSCARVLCPARSLCPRCFEVTGEPVAVGPEGVVVSWTDVPGRGTFGLVRLDGADGAMLHRLLGESYAWTVGTRVRPRFALQRTGSILDIEGFEPTGEEER